MAEYSVKKGDNLTKIAKAYNTTVAELVKLNNIKSKNLMIKIGQTLKLPDTVQSTAGTQAGSAAPQPATDTSTAVGTGQQPDEWKTVIEDIYSKSKDAQQKAISGRYDPEVYELGEKKKKASGIYDPLRDEAYLNSGEAERSRREAMANMGLSEAGGTSQELEQRNKGALLTALGGITREQQDYTNNINLAISKLDKQKTADLESLDSQIYSEKKRALLDQENWAQNYGLQQSQYKLAKDDSEFNTYMELYGKKLITKKQLKEKFPGLF